MSLMSSRYAAMVAGLLAAASLPLYSCGGEMEDEATQDALARGYWRLQNYETSFARRCVASGGVNGGLVGAAICNGLSENQGYTFDATTTKRNWLKSQTTGPAKCLAATTAGTVVNAVCTESVASQQWTRAFITGTSRAIYSNGGKCLTMATDGVLSIAPCVIGSRKQEWLQGSDQTLFEALNGGIVQLTDVPTMPPDVVVPATAGTIAYTQQAISKWELTYIKFQPTRVLYESRGIVIVGRDQWGAPRYYFRGLHINDPRTPADIHHTWTSALPVGSLFIDANIINGVPKNTVFNGIPNNTAHATALALLLRDVKASLPVAAVAAPLPTAIKPTADIIKQLTADDVVTATLEVGAVLLEVAGCPVCAIIVGGIPLLKKVFPDNPKGGTPNCGSEKRNVNGGSGQCEIQNRPVQCNLVQTTNSCAVQNSHALPSTESHGRTFCTTPLPTGPGLSCSKHRIAPESPLCDVDCVQTHTECEWAWCQIPPK